MVTAEIFGVLIGVDAILELDPRYNMKLLSPYSPWLFYLTYYGSKQLASHVRFLTVTDVRRSR